MVVASHYLLQNNYADGADDDADGDGDDDLDKVQQASLHEALSTGSCRLHRRTCPCDSFDFKLGHHQFFSLIIEIDFCESSHSHSNKIDFYWNLGIPGVRNMGPGVCPSVSKWCFADLTDVSLVDEDINLILADDTKLKKMNKSFKKNYLKS